MPTRLRSLSLTIEEPEPGLFEWVLNEGSSASVGLDASTQDYRSWHEALEAGIAALRALAPDLDSGPRELPTDDA